MSTKVDLVLNHVLRLLIKLFRECCKFIHCRMLPKMLLFTVIISLSLPPSLSPPPLSLPPSLSLLIHTPLHTPDALLAITVNGVAKLWLLPSRSEIKDQEHIYEERSKSLDITNAPVSLVSYSYSNHCIVLAVWTQVWQVCMHALYVCL